MLGASTSSPSPHDGDSCGGGDRLRVRCSYANVAFEWTDSHSAATLNSLVMRRLESSSCAGPLGDKVTDDVGGVSMDRVDYHKEVPLHLFLYFLKAVICVRLFYF